MNIHCDIITDFYTAFARKDHETMNQFYSIDAIFRDPVFKRLNAEQAAAMWEMFCVQSKTLEITFGKVKANDRVGSAVWQATYTFPTTNRKVVNTIKARFWFENEKIIQHDDHFSFYKWSRQALGMPGYLLGWTPFLKNKVRKSAMKSLKRFMEHK